MTAGPFILASSTHISGEKDSVRLGGRLNWSDGHHKYTTLTYWLECEIMGKRPTSEVRLLSARWQ